MGTEQLEFVTVQELEILFTSKKGSDGEDAATIASQGLNNSN